MVKLLDATLRDGSFVIDYRFTLDHVRNIVAGLEESGVDFIEVGNGNGVGAAEQMEIIPNGLHTDAEYVQAARKASKGKSKIGVIAHPLWSKDEFMEPLWDSIDFVRISLELRNLENLPEFIEKIKGHNKLVFLQMVRSSAVPLQELVDLAKHLETLAPDVIYVVDTGGFFRPEQVEETVTAVREAISIPVGFHGHNHMQLAVANTLAALKAGATYVDGCLHSLGKGPGNAQTEILAHFLNLDHDRNMDESLLARLAAEEILPLSKKHTVAGTTEYYFHCARYGIDLPHEGMASIRDGIGVTAEEILAEFAAIPNFFDFDQKTILQVIENLKAKKKIARCA